MGILCLYPIFQNTGGFSITMTKRITALILCIILLAATLVSCSGNKDDKGAYITMYLTDDIYDFDPVNAYYNSDAVNVLGLMYEPLFTVSESGKIEKALAKSYKYFTDDDGVHLEITLKDAVWSNNYSLTASDCVFAWRRLLDPENGFAAASLLYDIKNARAYNEGYMTKDDLKVEAVEQQVVRITFEGEVNVDDFLMNLTSIATAPLLETAVKGNADWAKKASTLVTNGPFKMGKIKYDTTGKKVSDDNALEVDGSVIRDNKGNIDVGPFKEQKIISFYLERNAYYYRDVERDSISSSVTPFRILVDCTMDDETLLAEFENDHLFYIGNIPLSLRDNAMVKKNADISDALSTFSCLFNQNKEINGVKLFADEHIRKALSLVIDREAIAEAVVYAEAATALVGPSIFEKGTSGSFRKVGGGLISTKASLEAAQAELTKVEIANFRPSDFTFSITVASYDEVHKLIVGMIKEAWESLGFKVEIKELTTIQNNDKRIESNTESIPLDVCDDLFLESIQRATFDVVALDYKAYTADAYSMLANFARSFSGKSSLDSANNYVNEPNVTGYNSFDYETLMEAVYYIPYYTQMDPDPAETVFINPDTNPYAGFGLESKADYAALYNRITSVYAKYGMTPSDKSSQWAAQKAMLLHEAEKLLMNDMPIIPVIFNQNAILVNSKISKISANYYVPAYFRKTKLKNYADYFFTEIKRYADNKQVISTKQVSIFDKFPVAAWDKIGTTEYVEVER